MTRCVITAGVLVCLLAAMPVASAQDESVGSRGATEARVTQAELAQILVNVLGLSRFLSPTPTPQELTAILLDNGIAPFDGWAFDKTVTRADLARVIVLAMDRADEVQNPDDPRSWISFLASIGVSIDTIGEAVDNLDPLAEPVAQNVFVVSATTDPLKKRAKFGEPDESEFGTDVEFVPHWRPVNLREIELVIQAVEFPPVKRKPPTPT